MIKVIFSTTGGIGSRLLRVMMASPYSHCGIVAGDDVIEASTHGFALLACMTSFEAQSGMRCANTKETMTRLWLQR